MFHELLLKYCIHHYSHLCGENKISFPYLTQFKLSFTSEKLKNNGIEPAIKDPISITTTKDNSTAVSSISDGLLFHLIFKKSKNYVLHIQEIFKTAYVLKHIERLFLSLQKPTAGTVDST